MTNNSISNTDNNYYDIEQCIDQNNDYYDENNYKIQQKVILNTINELNNYKTKIEKILEININKFNFTEIQNEFITINTEYVKYCESFIDIIVNYENKSLITLNDIPLIRLHIENIDNLISKFNNNIEIYCQNFFKINNLFNKINKFFLDN